LTEMTFCRVAGWWLCSTNHYICYLHISTKLFFSACEPGLYLKVYVYYIQTNSSCDVSGLSVDY